jgi:D-alanine-D-alanine ligase
MIDASGELYILETNTLPGMTETSLYPKAASVAGLTMPQLCDKLANFALAR